MENTSFSIKEALSIGWRKSWEQARFLFGLFGMWVGYIMLLVIVHLLSDKAPISWVITLTDSLIVSPILLLGVSRIYYDMYMTGKSSYKQLYASKKYYFTNLFATVEIGFLCLGWVAVSAAIVFGAIYCASYVSFIRDNAPHSYTLMIVVISIPCAMVFFNMAAMFLFVPATIISDDVSHASDALKMSKAITKGYRAKLLLFGFFSIILIVISIGLLMSTVGIAWMHVYKKLKNFQKA